MRGSFSSRLVALALALCALALVAAGCGSDDGGDANSSGDPQAEIRSVVEESFSFEDPETVCEENLTEAALEEGFEGEDHEARVEACKEDEPAGFAKLEVSKVKVRGSTATAAVEAFQPNGRSSKFMVRLRNEDGWKLDRIG